MRPLSRPLLLVLLLAGAASCRGDRSSEPPIHLNPNMDQQARLDPQEPFAFFWDGRAMRRPPTGTVAVGHLKTDRHLHEGRVAGGFARTLPSQVRLDLQLLERGRERYNVFCAPCHDRAGYGEGPVYRRNAGLSRPANLHDARLRALPVGEIVSIVSRGKNNMPKLAAQIPIADRWAITAYVRALQLSQHAPADPAGNGRP